MNANCPILEYLIQNQPEFNFRRQPNKLEGNNAVANELNGVGRLLDLKLATILPIMVSQIYWRGRRHYNQLH